jgi:hypothetical protein
MIVYPDVLFLFFMYGSFDYDNSSAYISSKLAGKSAVDDLK